MDCNNDVPLSRRLFLGGIAAAGSAAAAGPNPNEPEQSEANRARHAYQIRVDAARPLVELKPM